MREAQPTVDENTNSKKGDPETIAMLWWILIGIILLSIAYVIPSRSPSFWAPLHAAGLVTGVYLLALVIYLLRKPLRLSRRLLLGIIALLVIGVTAFAWIRAESGTKEIVQGRYNRGVVAARGILQTEMSWRLKETLEAYYQLPSRQRQSLAEVFVRQNRTAAVGSDIHERQFGGDRKIFVQALERDRIVLVGQEMLLRGRNPEFRNFDGKLGMVQERMTLTVRGLTHESEN